MIQTLCLVVLKEVEQVFKGSKVQKYGLNHNHKTLPSKESGSGIMHDENAGNLCHKFHTNATGPFTDFGAHSTVMPKAKQEPWL